MEESNIKPVLKRAEALIEKLQDPPELIEQMFEKWREGFKVVYASGDHAKERLLLKNGYRTLAIV